MDIKAIDQKYVANTYARFPVQIVSGKRMTETAHMTADLMCSAGLKAQPQQRMRF